MNKIEIKDWRTKEVIFFFEKENNTIKETLEEAVKQGVDLSFADLANANLSYANLSNAKLNYANLERCKLFLTDLRNADLKNTSLFFVS